MTEDANIFNVSEIANLVKDTTRDIEHGDKGDEESVNYFGLIPLPKSMRPVVDMGWTWFKPRMRKLLEDGVKKGGDWTLSKVLTDASKIPGYTKFAADAVGWAFTFQEPILGAKDAVVERRADRQTVLKQLTPLLDAYNLPHTMGSVYQILGKDNELLQAETARIHEKFWQNLLGNSFSQIWATIPQVVIKRYDDRARKIGKSDEGIGPTSGESDDVFLEREFKRIDREAEREFKRQEHVDAKMEKYRKRYEERGIDPSSYEARRTLSKLEDRLLEGYKSTGEQEKVSQTAYELWSQLGPPVGSLATTLNRKSIENRFKKHPRYKEMALTRICHLYDELSEKKSAETVDGMPLADYIKETFQVEQDNVGQRRMGERLEEDLTAACEQIAEAVKKGRLNPMALVQLVSERRIVHKDGKGIATRTEIKTAIDELIEKLPAKFAVDSDKFISESTFNDQNLKALLGQLQGAEKDIFAYMIPDEVLKKMEWKDEDIKAMRQRAKPSIGTNLRHVLLDMATLPDEALKSAKAADGHEIKLLTDVEIKLLRDTAEKSKEEGACTIIESMSTFGNFKEGIDWTILNYKSYWEDIATGKRRIGDLYRNAGGKLLSEKQREEEDAKRAEEEKKLAEQEKQDAAKEAKSGTGKDKAATPEDEKEEDVPPKEGRDWKLKKDPENEVTESKHRGRVDKELGGGVAL